MNLTRVTIALVGILLLSCAEPSGELEYFETASLETASSTTDYNPVLKVVLPEGKGLCTGTQVSPRAVLTAAHCTTDRGSYRVILPEGSRTTRLIEDLDQGILGDTGDLSLLIFPENFGDEYIPLATDGVAHGDLVRVVGYGCDDLDTKLGTGIKRTGTNRVARATEFLELATPLKESNRRILGPSNMAGSCFGDSGGPMLRFSNGRLRVVGVAHAGGWNRNQLISRYVDLSRSRNKRFLQDVDRQYELGLFDACTQEPGSVGCEVQQASTGISSLLFSIWHWISMLF